MKHNPGHQILTIEGQLTANQPVDNYWIRANPNTGPTQGFAGGINSAILRYVGADAVEPTTPLVTATNPLSELNLHPLDNPAAPGQPFPGGVDYPLNLNLVFVRVSDSLCPITQLTRRGAQDGSTLKFQINGATFVPPTVPVLLQILSGAQSAQDLLPSGSIYALPANAVIELSLPALAAGGPHPFHLHGHAFSVVKPSGATESNYVNPVRRDVVSIGAPPDNVTIRFEVRYTSL